MHRADSRRSLLDDQGGVAYVEFLLAFVPLFMFFVGMIQMATLYGASLLVEHAADRAARAAATMIDDDPRYYRGDARGNVGGESLDPGALWELYTRRALRPVNVGEIPLSRVASITAAGALPLLILVPHGSSASSTTIAVDVLQRLEVTLHDPDAWDTERSMSIVVDSEEIMVRVRFRYPCAIPVGGRLVCGPSAEHLFVAEARRAVHRADYPYLEGTSR